MHSPSASKTCSRPLYSKQTRIAKQALLFCPYISTQPHSPHLSPLPQSLPGSTWSSQTWVAAHCGRNTVPWEHPRCPETAPSVRRWHHMLVPRTRTRTRRLMWPRTRVGTGTKLKSGNGDQAGHDSGLLNGIAQTSREVRRRGRRDEREGMGLRLLAEDH